MPRIREWLFLMVLVATATSVGFWHERCVKKGVNDPLVSGVRSVVMPVQNAASYAWRGVGDFVWGVTHAREVRQQSRRLQQRIAVLDLENQRLREVGAEATRMRALLNLAPKMPKSRIGADIVGAYLDQNSITLNRGAGDGIEVGAPVMSGEGLVGQVNTVDRATCQVTLVTSPELNVGARVQRPESRAFGICQGQGNAYMLMDYLPPNADIKEGDLIVTSGLSKTYPKGIIIGRAYRVWTDPVYNVRRASVKLAADADRLEEVFILK